MCKIVSGFLIILAMIGCSGKHSAADAVNKELMQSTVKRLAPSSFFNESWESNTATHSFSLDLKLKNDSIYGSYCFASQKRIDCGDREVGETACKIHGIAKGNEARIWFTSAYDEEDKTDTAFLIANEQFKTLVIVKQTAHIYSYFPDTLTLHK